MSIRRWFAGTSKPQMSSDETEADRAFAAAVEASRVRSEHRANRLLCLSCEAGIQAPRDIRWEA